MNIKETHSRSPWRTVALVLVVAVADILFSVAAIGMGIEDGSVPDPENAGLEWARFGFAPIFAPLGAIALIWRHRFPKSVAAATAVLCSLSISGIAFFVALYLLSRRRLSWWVAAVIALYIVVETFVGIGPMSWGIALALVLLLAAIAAWGAYRGQKTRTKEAQLASFKDRAERTEAQRIADTERTQLAERHRIAREMHDTLAHRMSLVAVQAAALQVDAPDAETANAAKLIRETAHAALGELRDVLGVLHEDGTASGRPAAEEQAADQGRTAPSGIAQISSLVEQWRQAGLSIEYTPTTALSLSLSDAVSRAAYRVVQEGLTNVARHAPEAAATVTLELRGPELHILVVNGAGEPAEAVVGAGLGLIGLRERVELLGGLIESGPTESGFQLSTIIPAEISNGGQPQL